MAAMTPEQKPITKTVPAIAAAFSDRRNVSVPPVSSTRSAPRPLVESTTSASNSGVRRQLIVTSARSERPLRAPLQTARRRWKPHPFPTTSAVRPVQAVPRETRAPPNGGNFYASMAPNDDDALAPFHTTQARIIVDDLDV